MRKNPVAPIRSLYREEHGGKFITDVSVLPISPILKVQECEKKPVQQYGVYIGKSVGVINY